MELSDVGAASAGPRQSEESVGGGRSRRRYRARAARGCTLSSGTLRLHVGETGKLTCCQQGAGGLGLHGRFNVITADVTSSGNGLDDEDSSEEMIYATAFPGWDRSVAKDEYAASTTLVTSENEKRPGPTQHPLLHSVHSGWISHEQNPASTTESIEQHEFTVAGENGGEKESPHTGPTAGVHGNQGPHKGHYESTTFPEETTTTTITTQPRSAQVPEWLIIVAALVALALILAVCIAVNSRRRCGQKKKLVINNGKGAVEDRKTSGLNGDASKSQEMVHLVHKEQSNDRRGACDEFLTVNETQNHQELDMKSGV